MKHHLRILLVTLFLIFSIVAASEAQQSELINPKLLENRWDAHWVTHPTASNQEYGVFHFRKTFDVSEIPETFIVHVSGDTRYRFFVNGVSVSTGPAVGDKHNWRFATLDIAKFIKPGKNVVSATVWNFDEYNALSHHSFRTAFLLQGNSEKESVVNTGNGWKVSQNKGYSPIPVTFQDVAGYYAAPHGEHLITENYPWGWKKGNFNDANWLEVQLSYRAEPWGTQPAGGLFGWNLIPRNIPLMEEHEERIPEVRRTRGIEINEGFLDGSESLVIPANSQAVLLLDQKYITNAYPRLEVSGGQDAEIKLIYAESLRHEDNTKGNRNEIKGKKILGLHDIFITDGGKNRILQTLWLRSYRYIQLEIETAGDPLTLHEMYGLATGYPFEENAEFNSSDDSLAKIWENGWRTARLNAFESYWDCAYYEQLQYVGDTRIQALISLYVSGDDRLMRNALLHFDHSRMPDGITMSRYPSRHPQYIPPYSLLHIAMVHDYWMHRKDDEFVKQFLPGIRSVIGWFEDYLDKDLDILGPMPWWSFVDWGFPGGGRPPVSEDGHSIVITLQMLYVLDYAAELAEGLGQEYDAAYYRNLIQRLRTSIPEQGWSRKHQMMADTPDFEHFSQHANILAVLTDLIPESNQESLMKRIMDNEEIVQTTYYFRFYLFRAMRKAGLGNEYLDQLDPWYDALKLGMTTFPEQPEPSRSDAHAWSASPNYDFLASVTGIRPDAPGFSSVLIEPKPGHLEWVEATMPHPFGEIQVKFSVAGDRLTGTVTLPQGLKGRFLWNEKEILLQSGEQEVDVK